MSDKIICPSCYRRDGSIVEIKPHTVRYTLPWGGNERKLVVYECERDACDYDTTEDELLAHEYRVKYNQLHRLFLYMFGWVSCPTRNDFGKLLTIRRAIKKYCRERGYR